MSNVVGRIRMPDAQDADLEASSLPYLAVDGVARVEEASVSDERGGEVHVQVLEGAMVNEQNHRVGVAQCLLDGQNGRRQSGGVQHDVWVAQTDVVPAVDRELRNPQRRALAYVVHFRLVGDAQQRHGSRW